MVVDFLFDFPVGMSISVGPPQMTTAITKYATQLMSSASHLPVIVSRPGIYAYITIFVIILFIVTFCIILL